MLLTDREQNTGVDLHLRPCRYAEKDEGQIEDVIEVAEDRARTALSLMAQGHVEEAVKLFDEAVYPDHPRAISSVVSRRRYEQVLEKHNDLLEAVRTLMDETDPDGEGSASRNLRRWVMDDDDTEAIIQAEGHIG